MVRARDYRLSPTCFEFKYGVDGNEYSWFEAYFIGPDGMTYFWAAISIASFIALILIIAIILCIVRCARSVDGVNQVHDITEVQKLQPNNSSIPNQNHETPGNGMESSRNPAIYNPMKEIGGTPTIETP